MTASYIDFFCAAFRNTAVSKQNCPQLRKILHFLQTLVRISAMSFDDRNIFYLCEKQYFRFNFYKLPSFLGSILQL